MYNKYFTMKKSELKEAIKAEIKSVLSEEMSPEEMDSKRRQAMTGGAKAGPLAKLATIGLEGKTVRIKGNSQEYKVEKVMKNGDVLISRNGGEKTLTKRPMELELVNEIAPMGPGQTTTLADFEDEEEVKVNNSKKIKNPVEELFFHADSYKKNMIDVDDIKQAFEEILRDYKDDIIADRSVSFSDIREEDEAPAGDKKTEKAARGADKAKDDYAKLAGKDNTEISKASSLVKEKAKKAKEGDKEALNFLKSNQKVIKAYNDLKK